MLCALHWPLQFTAPAICTAQCLRKLSCVESIRGLLDLWIPFVFGHLKALQEASRQKGEAGGLFSSFSLSARHCGLALSLCHCLSS